MALPDAIVADLSSPDDHRVCEAVRAATAVLEGTHGAGRSAIGERLVPLALHASPRVRQAVAEA